MKKDLDWTKGKIYKMTNTVNSDIYVGSTVTSLIMRQYGHNHAAEKGHESKLYTFMREFGLLNFKIELLENCNVTTRMGLLEREQFWINKLQPTLNTNGVVSYKLATPEQLEAKRQKLHDSYRKWFASHREQHRAYKKSSYAKIKAQSIHVCCPICHKKLPMTGQGRARHEFTLKHIKYRDQLIKTYKTCKPVEIIHFTLE